MMHIHGHLGDNSREEKMELLETNRRAGTIHTTSRCAKYRALSAPRGSRVKGGEWRKPLWHKGYPSSGGGT